MGVSCTKSSNSNKIGAPVKLSTRSLPDLIGDASENLTFNIIISNIKTRSIPLSTSSLKLSFGKDKEFYVTELTLVSKNFSWNFTKEFDYSTTRQGLREESLKISLLEKSGKEIGDVEINLYDLATGPYHIDYFIKMRKGYKEPGRINLDIKMSQMIHLTVKTQDITCRLKDNLKEKFYNFSLKMLTKEQEFFSDHSNNYKNIIVAPALSEKSVEENKENNENYQLIMDENKILQTNYFATDSNKKSPRLRQESESGQETFDLSENLQPLTQQSRISSFKTGAMSKINQSTLTRNKDIVWDFKESITSGVTLEANGSLRDLVVGSFQFFLWTNKESINNWAQKDEEHSQEVYIDHKLVGECYISVKKLFEDIEINFGEENIKEFLSSKENQVKLSHFQEKLWYHGVCIGELDGAFIVQITPFYKQMICGVRTEEGVQKSSTVYLNKDKGASFFKNTTNIKEIKTLEQLKDNLKTIVFHLSDTEANPRAKIKFVDELSVNVHKVLEILKSSHKESIPSFLYKTPENLLSSQRVLISIAKHLVDYSDEVPVTLRPIYYECLLLIINRGELQLNVMGFDQSYAEFLKNAQKISFKSEANSNKIEVKNIQGKLEVCERYQALLYMTLKKILEKLNQKGLSNKERDFVEQFTAIAYFRVPEFRKKMLEKILASIKDVSIEEWRGTEWKLGEQIEDENKNSQLMALFDWEGDFYVYLKNTENGEKNYQLLNEILNDPSWQNRIQKRGIAFYFFLTEWAKHVNSTVVIKEHVPWQDLPGYNILTKAFLVALKQKDVKAYPEAMINASVAFLKNEKLLNTYIAIIYNKTRLYDSQNVFQVFELINTWLVSLRENGKTIPTTFDYNFFFKGIYMVLEEDHALNIAKVLWVLYNNFNALPYDQKQQLSEFVFGRNFFKFFLHWSWNVRQVFHHFLLYRLYHQHRTANTNLQNLDDLKKELLLYNQRRKNVKQTKKILINDFINMEYSRNMTIIENGYKKLKEQKTQQKKVYLKKSNKLKKPTKTKNFSHVIDVPQRLLLEQVSSTETKSKASTNQKDSEFEKLQLRGSQSERKMETGNLELVSAENSSSQINSSFDQPNASYWMVNPDRLDTTLQEPIGKVGRSESMKIEANFMTGSKNNKSGNLEDIQLNIDDKTNEVENYECPQNKFIESPKLIQESNDKKKVIHRRIIYFDKQSKQIKEIPEQYIVYLEAAYTEYESTKEQYLVWLTEVEERLKNKKEEEIKKWKADPKVPELLVKIPMDENVPEPDQEG